MKRRTALKSLGLGFGYTMTLGGLSTFFSSCQEAKEEVASWKPSFLSIDQSSFLEALMDQILPTTDSSPGFKDLKGIEYVDLLLDKIYDKEEQTEFSTGLTSLLSEVGISKLEKGWFTAIKPETIPALLKKYMSASGTSEESSEAIQNTVTAIRDLAISSYFGHPTIAMEHLNYDPIPGEYSGCVPVSDIGNAWTF